MGADLFASANAAKLLNEDNNRSSPEYAPIIDRLLRDAGTTRGVKMVNSTVLDGTPRLCAQQCWDSRFVTFRNKVRRRRSSQLCSGAPINDWPSSILQIYYFIRILYFPLPLSQVIQILTCPTMRAWRSARRTPLFLSTAQDVLFVIQRVGRAKQVTWIVKHVRPHTSKPLSSARP